MYTFLYIQYIVPLKRTLIVLTLSGFFFLCIGSSCHILRSHRHHTRIDSVSLTGDIDSLEVYDILEDLGKPWRKLSVEPIKEYKDYLTFTEMRPGKDYARIADSLGGQPVSKADFDCNGLKDLLLVGSYFGQYTVLVILDSGNKKYQKQFLASGPFQDITFPVIRCTRQRPEILYYSFPKRLEQNDTNRDVLRVDTLEYKYGGFIEKNPSPSTFKIERIQYKTGECYGGECPVFQIVIDSSGNAVYFADRFNKDYSTGKEVKGTFTATIERQSFKEIHALLSYLNFPSLRSKYRVSWTHDQSCVLTITYNGGKTKTIDDYGLLGSHGLTVLYDKLSRLRNNQNWK